LRKRHTNYTILSEPAQTIPEPADRGEPTGVKGPYHGVKGGHERALLVVKGRKRWHKGTVRLERSKYKGPIN